MFVGHFAVAFGAKRAAPRASLGTYFLAAQFLDLLWPTLVLLGVETVSIDPGNTAVTPLDFTSYPYSHSLVGALALSAVFGTLYGALRRDARTALVLGGAVASHWVLDFVTHRPDLPLDLSSDVRLGLGLWNSLAWTLAVELSMFAAGAWLYLRGTRAKDRIGSWALWGLLGFLLATYFGAVLGPPPPSVDAIAWSGEAIWLLVAWGYWVDRHRMPTMGIPSRTTAHAAVDPQ